MQVLNRLPIKVNNKNRCTVLFSMGSDLNQRLTAYNSNSIHVYFFILRKTQYRLKFSKA